MLNISSSAPGKPSGKASGAVLCACLLALALCLSACAGAPAPDPAGPRANEPPYPVLLRGNADKRAATLAAWNRLMHEEGITNAPDPELQPATATIRSLPPLAGHTLSLPKVGEGATMTEEESREALRRFITAESALVGAQPQQLSLVTRTDGADGTQTARYEQRPFRSYQLRNGYGILEITFTPDRRILQLTSTCIPDIEQLQRAGAGTRPRMKAEEVAAFMVNKQFTYRDAGGADHPFTVGPADQLTVRELVIYPLPRAADPSVLEFHLAWEITVGREPAAINVYLDAVTDEVIAAQQFSK
ncbi:MAG TPA: hypothetical protein VF723_11785 [Pyrinomonadaceae bacterium]